MDKKVSVTGGLRRYIRLLADRWESDKRELTEIADRIDAEHEEALREAYTAGRGDGMAMTNAKDAQAEYLRGKNDGYDVGWDEAMKSCENWAVGHEDEMAEHGWYRALDADKKPVRIGAEMDSDHYEDGTVVGLQFFNTANKTPRVLIVIRPHGWDTPTWRDPEDYRHHHAPTVEDVLTEFGIDWEHESDCEDRAALLAEYAAKLRLAGDAE